MSWQNLFGLGGATMGGLGSQMPTSTSSTGASSSSGATTPTYSGEQASTQSSLLSSLNQTMADPMKAVQPMENAATDSINKTYDGLSGRMQKFLAGRGFGASGTMGQNQQGLELSRAGDIAGSNAKFSDMALGNYNTALADALGAAFKNPGSSSSSTTTGSGGTTSSGNLAGGALSGFGGAMGSMAPALAQSM